MAISSAPRNDRAQIATVGAITLSLSGIVLLIACLNLANMLLARGAARRREFAVRQALGARGWRLVRQLLTEGFLLAALGAVAGVVLAAMATDWLFDSMAQSLPFSFDFDPLPDVRVLAATLGFSLLATLFFALGPALKSVRLDVNTELKEGAGEAARSLSGKLLATRNLLIIGQVALSLCLLVAAGLAGRGAIQAIRIDPGFDLDRGFFLQVDGSLAGYNETETRRLYRRVMERVGSLPGVEAASMALSPPFADLVFGQRVQQGGAPFPPPPDAATPVQGKAIPANYNVIGPDYFRALGVTLQQGREFRSTEFTDADALIREAREEVRRLDPALPMLAAKSLRFHLETNSGVLVLRIGALSFATFGGVALLLALIGVYGVNAYMVARRTREIGVRMALGANRGGVLRLFLREGVILTGAGLALGLVLAGLVARMMRDILFEVSPFDPLVFGLASALLAGAALIACWLPARRATKVDPMEALRRG